MRKYLILYLNLLIFLCNGQDKKPNIILILADDLSPAYLGCYGGNTPTPELDKLAKEGVKFTNAHAATPLCNPSRYTLLTGQYAGRNKNVYQNVLTSNPYFGVSIKSWGVSSEEYRFVSKTRTIIKTIDLKLLHEMFPS